MMKRYLPIILIYLCLAGSVSGGQQQLLGVLARVNAGGAAATNWTLDADCATWYMNANTGNETDRGGNVTGANLTENGGSIPTSATVPAGYSGTSRDFERTDSEELLENDSGFTDISGADQDIGMCIWYKPEDTAASAFMTKAGTVNQGQYQFIAYTPDATYVASFVIYSDGTDGSAVQAFGTTDLQSGTWYHLCGVYDDDEGSGDNVQVWVNGVREGTASGTGGIFDGTDQFMIGGRADDAFWSDGLKDEAIICSQALTSAEINGIKDNGISGNKGGSD